MIQRIVVVSVCAALVSLSPRIAAAEDVVTLKFDWPDGVRAKVTLEQTIVTETDNEKHTLRGTSTYIIEAAPMSGQLLITTKDHRNVKKSYDEQEMNKIDQWLPYAQELLPLSQKTNMWAYLVSKEGTFVGLHDFIGAHCEREAMRRFLQSDDPKKQEVIAECRKKTEESEDFWRNYIQQSAYNQAAQDWMRIASLWAGTEMVEREIYESSTSLTTDESPGIAIPLTSTSKLIGRFPCKQGMPDANCVRVESVELLDTGDELRPLMEVLDILLPALAQERRGPDFTKGTLRKRTEIHLLTDPATLLPHWIEEIETIRVTVRNYNVGEPSAISTKAHRTWTYEYEQPN